MFVYILHMCVRQAFMQMSQNCVHTAGGADVNFASVLAHRLVTYIFRCSS